jgi:hypothetical protein
MEKIRVCVCGGGGVGSMNLYQIDPSLGMSSRKANSGLIRKGKKIQIIVYFIQWTQKEGNFAFWEQFGSWAHMRKEKQTCKKRIIHVAATYVVGRRARAAVDFLRRKAAEVALQQSEKRTFAYLEEALCPVRFDSGLTF